MVSSRRLVAPSALGLLLVAILFAGREHLGSAPPPPRFVEPGANGRLVYDVDTRGNRIPDFSHAGYRGGGVPLPEVPARVTVAPAEGDDTARLQAAIDTVSGCPIDAQGRRGAVVLASGRFEVAGSLHIRTSGVVLRGHGAATTVVATGNRRRTLIELHGRNDRRTIVPARRITDDYVPVNARDVGLDSVVGLKPGDALLVRRPSPAKWIDFMGMGSVAGRPAPSWAADKMEVEWERRVTSVHGNRVTFDVPLTCALDSEFGGGSVTKYEWPGRLREVGVEHLRCESEWDRANPHDEEHAWMAVTLANVEDAWVRQVTGVHFVSSLVSIEESGRRITVEDCASLAPVSEVAGYRRHSFYTSGQQTLFLRCRAEEGRHDFAAGWLAAGPNAFVECSAREAHDFSGPIESWATGVLYDNIVMDGGGLRFDNRELWDNGVGWAAANCVMWQCTVPVVVARTPPGAHNWVIGCWAQFAGDARWRSPNEFVKPDSLYAAQLTERLGRAALNALVKREIPTSANAAVAIDQVVTKQSEAAISNLQPQISNLNSQILNVVNGWLTVDGRLLIGGQPGLTWWRGHTQPNRAAEFGIHLTRFVPGRRGPGLTDDLHTIAESMVARGDAALRHHWGLWYDRRRDDHQMTRRLDAGVWPPFYESPWARSGQGRAWDGMSRYDLMKFNPWYFGRLREFADLCEQHGLLFLNAMYFQHNVLEAGAHWSDFPWRPANCLQATGFPEPPPYANGKRIFMAEAFYDATHPVRRPLHRAYIRQCLDNLADRPNVLHVLGEEFTGPLHFMQFWLDTIAEWRADTGRRVLVGLSAPKDVQDAILSDPKRRSQIDVIDLKYWWRSGNKLFAPRGGQNLAPRQHEREAKIRRPDDDDLARMVTEVRTKAPGKPVLCDFPSAGWAFVCAGGSVANLPRTTDARLRSAIPGMVPWPAASNDQQWALRDPAGGYLIHSAADKEVQLDLRGERGAFVVNVVNHTTGAVTARGERLEAGRVVLLKKPAVGKATLWLRRE